MMRDVSAFSMVMPGSKSLAASCSKGKAAVPALRGRQWSLLRGDYSDPLTCSPLCRAGLQQRCRTSMDSQAALYKAGNNTFCHETASRVKPTFHMTRCRYPSKWKQKLCSALGCPSCWRRCCCLNRKTSSLWRTPSISPTGWSSPRGWLLVGSRSEGCRAGACWGPAARQREHGLS